MIKNYIYKKPQRVNILRNLGSSYGLQSWGFLMILHSRFSAKLFIFYFWGERTLGGLDQNKNERSRGGGQKWAKMGVSTSEWSPTVTSKSNMQHTYNFLSPDKLRSFLFLKFNFKISHTYDSASVPDMIKVLC